MNNAQSLEEQITILQVQHSTALDQWKYALSDVSRYQLNLQMVDLERDVANLELQINTKNTPSNSKTPKDVLFPALKTHDLIFDSAYQNEQYVIDISHSQSSFAQIKIAAPLVEEWLHITKQNYRAAGTAMYSHIASSINIAGVFAEAYDHSRRKHAQFRFIVRASDDSKLLQLPWEMLHSGKDFLMELFGFTLLYEIASTLPKPTQIQDLKHRRILFTSSSTVDISIEANNLTELTEHYPNTFDLVQLHRHTPMRLLKYFQKSHMTKQPFHIWHHHGQVEIKGDHFRLSMGGKSISSRDINKLINQVDGLMVFMIWTEGNLTSRQLQQLRAEMIRWDVGTIIHLHNDIANHFSENFFTMLYTIATMRPFSEAYSWVSQTFNYNKILIHNTVYMPLIFTKS